MGLSGFEVEVEREGQEGLETEEMTLNMGPQHPSTHGVLRFVVKADGEVMRQAIPDIGYLHRSIEKISEKVGYHGFMPYTDRVDYVAAMFCNQGWGMVCEKLAGIEVPKRGEYCRVIAAELNRIASHLISVGTMVLDIGATTPFFHAIREREKINDLLDGPGQFTQKLDRLPEGVDLKKFQVPKDPKNSYLRYNADQKQLETNLHLLPKERDSLLAMAKKTGSPAGDGAEGAVPAKDANANAAAANVAYAARSASDTYAAELRWMDTALEHRLFAAHEREAASTCGNEHAHQ